MKDKNYKEIINDINKILNEICDDGRMKYHIIPVVKISVEMAKELKADEQVVEIAAYLHDVTRILGDKENHHITGAKYARDFLEKYAFDMFKAGTSLEGLTKEEVIKSDFKSFPAPSGEFKFAIGQVFTLDVDRIFEISNNRINVFIRKRD